MRAAGPPDSPGRCLGHSTQGSVRSQHSQGCLLAAGRVHERRPTLNPGDSGARHSPARKAARMRSWDPGWLPSPSQNPSFLETPLSAAFSPPGQDRGLSSEDSSLSSGVECETGTAVVLPRALCPYKASSEPCNRGQATRPLCAAVSASVEHGNSPPVQGPSDE